MKFPSVSIAKRLLFTVIALIVISGFGFGLVINSLYNVESVLESESSQHIEKLTVNSVISRQVFELTTRVQLLEQAFLYSELTLAEEGFSIDQQLQKMSELSANPQLKLRMDRFIEDFHRFLGSSLTLNRIIREMKEIDQTLAEQLDTLDYLVADNKLNLLSQANQAVDNNTLDLVDLLRESFLIVGKRVGTIRSRITPETEKVVIIEVQKELDIMALHLANLPGTDEKLILQKKKLNRSLKKFNAALRKMQANLEQRWNVMAALVTSQNNLLNYVESTEHNVTSSAINLTQKLESDIEQTRLEALIVALLAMLSGLFLISRVVQVHIRKPLKSLGSGFEQLESSKFHQRIDLGRDDEWNDIERAFNNMAEKLEETYFQLNEEKKNFDFLAHHDPLTHLANRLLATKMTQETIDDSTLSESTFSVLYLDVDQFKTINDSLGHLAGDQLLIDVANSLKNIIDEKGFVARMGGDEFMIILKTAHTMIQAEIVAEAINQALRKPYFVNNKTIFVSSSIGVCMYPEHGHDVETLIRNADTAMYHAKRNGRDQYCCYTDQMTLEAKDLVEVSSGLRQALAKNELSILFQPQIDLATNKVVGAEALIRWDHPEYGRLCPADFLPIAEKTGFISEIDDWVFSQVVAYITRWKKAGIDLSGMKFSVNFSARKFYSANLVNKLDSVLVGTACQAEQIMLEITERDMMSGIETSVETINELRKRGFLIGIDDFGTGHSSLALLKQLPVDVVKLDRSFIKDIAVADRDFSIVRSIITLTKELELDVIAEGVECKHQAEKLVDIGCHYVQGYRYSKPLDEQQWLKLLASD
ncbi:EAL domain-containing protein [Vibrio viridaestus]|uniref:EAL domain-containing protein n=1 Tax=Vibrio viridaestus TaxID=2487322 RepID=A0A3N9TKR4_9VIBR|nr:EAL domain-containing protein [Vibrio viridaestus]RQW64867.1 EAL domain-containing protein [Vibrio viridaestus]